MILWPFVSTCWIFYSRASVWSFRSTKVKKFPNALYFDAPLLILVAYRIEMGKCLEQKHPSLPWVVTFSMFIMLAQNNSFCTRDSHKKWASWPACFYFSALAVHSKFKTSFFCHQILAPGALAWSWVCN